MMRDHSCGHMLRHSCGQMSRDNAGGDLTRFPDSLYGKIYHDYADELKSQRPTPRRAGVGKRIWTRRVPPWREADNRVLELDAGREGPGRALGVPRRCIPSPRQLDDAAATEYLKYRQRKAGRVPPKSAQTVARALAADWIIARSLALAIGRLLAGIVRLEALSSHWIPLSLHIWADCRGRPVSARCGHDFLDRGRRDSAGHGTGAYRRMIHQPAGVGERQSPGASRFCHRPPPNSRRVPGQMSVEFKERLRQSPRGGRGSRRDEFECHLGGHGHGADHGEPLECIRPPPSR